MVMVNTKRGFTLIELLVVISIISLLSSIVFSSLGSVRAKGRDAKRNEEIHQLQLALELYFDANGVYPPSGGATQPNGGWSNSGESASWGAGSVFQTAIAPYMSKLPVDPTNTSPVGFVTNEYYYVGISSNNCNSKVYMLVYKLENGANVVSPGFNTSACNDPTPALFQYNGSGALNTTSASGIITLYGKGF